MQFGAASVVLSGDTGATHCVGSVALKTKFSSSSTSLKNEATVRPVQARTEARTRTVARPKTREPTTQSTRPTTLIRELPTQTKGRAEISVSLF